MYDYIAHTTKGFEDISAEEIREKLADAQIIGVSAKKIRFSSEVSPSSLPLLQSIDDLGLLVSEGTVSKGDRGCISLSDQDLKRIVDIRTILHGCRLLENTYSLTISRYKAGDVVRDKLAQSLSKQLSSALQMDFTPTDHENFDVRIDCSVNSICISVKVFPTSVFFRSYRLSSQSGALRPSIAGAMVLAALGGKKTLHLVDNLCGSGTILCEAALAGQVPWGGDISSRSVKIASENLGTIAPNFIGSVRILDATSSPWRDGQFDAAISNMPWDEQVLVDSMTDLYEKVIKEYKRILKPEGTIGILSKAPNLAKKHIRKYFGDVSMVEYPLGFLGQKPMFIVGKSVRQSAE